MSKKTKTSSKRSVQGRLPKAPAATLAPKNRLANLGKLVNAVTNSFDIKTFQWIAGVVFGLALDAERAQAAAQATEELKLSAEDNADQALSETQDGDSSVASNEDAPVAAQGQHEHDARPIHLSPRAQMLLAQVATAPVTDAFDTLSQLKHFFADWFAQHPIPKVGSQDLAAGTDPVMTRDQAITQAIERAAIEFNTAPGSALTTTTFTELREMYPQQTGGGSQGTQFADLTLPLEFANEASGADLTRFAENAPNLGELGDGSGAGGFDPAYLSGLLGGLAGLGGGGGAAGAVASAAAELGGGAAGGGGVTAAIAGAAIDGLIQGATVDLQAFINGQWKTELQTTTDASGAYGFDLTKAAITNAAAVAEINAAKALSASNIRVVVEAGGYDQNTGQQVGQLVAGANIQTLTGNQTASVTAITPLTMVLASTSAISEDQLKAQLGITGVADLSTFNPIAAMSSSNAGEVQLGQAVFTIQQTMYTLIQSAAAVHAGGGAVGADALTSALNSVVDAISTSIASGASSVNVNAITASVIAEELGLSTSSTQVTTIANAIIATNNSVSSYYSHLANAYQTLAQDSSDATAQSWIAGAKAAAGVSQTDLIQAVDDYLTGATATIDVAAITNDIAVQASSMQQLLALQGATVTAATSLFVPVYLVSQVINESDGGLNDGLANGVLAKDAAGNVIANGNTIQLTDIASEISQVSLAELIKLNVDSVTVLGSNTKIQIALLGNGLSTVNLASFNDGTPLFDSSKVSVTLTVASQAQFNQVVANIASLEADGIYGFKSVAGSLTIDAATALD